MGHSAAKISFKFWAQDTKKTPDTILFLGVGQVGKTPKWVARHAPPGIVVVEGLPYWYSGSSATALEKFTRQYTTTALHAILKTFGMHSANLIGTSQATYAVIMLGLENPESVRNVGVVFPQGLTVRNLGSTPAERLKEFKRRALRTFLQYQQSPLHDLRNLYSTYRALQAILSDTHKASKHKFMTALSYDILPDLEKLLAQLTKSGGYLVVTLAEKDKIFRVSEVLPRLDAIKRSNLKILRLPDTTHSSLTLRSNRKPLARIVTMVRKPGAG